MPANLSLEYIKLDEKLRDARDPQEKLALLREMLRVIPKHKGTEKMQADLKRRISKFEETVDKQQKRGGRDLFHIAREGVAQLLLAGPPNCGKSSLVAWLTHASPQIASYPFTTHQPVPGMVSYEDVQMQLVDMPALARDVTEPGLFNAYRICDRIVLVADLGDPDPVEATRECLRLFEDHLIRVVPHRVTDEIGNLSTVEKPGLILATKLDLASPATREAFEDAFGGEFPVHYVSSETGEGLEDLPGVLFRELNLVRIYTKKPGKKFVRDAPFVLPAGATVLDVARAIHKDIAESLRFVRLWGSGKHEGLSVPRDHVVRDGDVLEFHAG
jgi:ribosome-interacting GTPase 1